MLFSDGAVLMLPVNPVDVNVADVTSVQLLIIVVPVLGITINIEFNVTHVHDVS